jgi:hypothetical protein
MSLRGMKTLLNRARALGPYMLVELVLPGGTLIALMMWLAQQKRAALVKVAAEVPKAPVPPE